MNAARPRSRRTTAVVGTIAAAVVALGVVAGVVATLESGSSALPGLLTGPAPWGPNTAELRPRLQDLGLNFGRGLVPESRVHLDIYVHRRRLKVPAGIGIRRGRTVPMAPVFTKGQGVFSLTEPLTLGDLFGVWGVRFTPNCVGGYCDQDGQTLKTFVNGARVPGDPRKLPLADRQEILVAYGTAAELPRPVPASYSF
jgi:hypothetical protein